MKSKVDGQTEKKKLIEDVKILGICDQKLRSENNKKMVKRKDDKEGRERGYRAGNAAERVKGK